MPSLKASAIKGASNGAKRVVESTKPSRYGVTITGDVPILFHAWNCEAIAEKSSARKNSAAKKTDDPEHYLYRDEKGYLCVPGENIRASMVEAGRYMQDPRSPRKSARDLIKAGIMVDDILPMFLPKIKAPDYIDKRRVTIQRSGITRERPALRAGRKLDFTLTVLTPEYLDERIVREILLNAGRLVGLCDFRPTYGRFSVVKFQSLTP